MSAGRVSFRSLFGDGRRVEIPAIQRDYAQGRGDEHSREVRRRFLDALGEALSARAPSAPPLDLDFVYGRWQNASRTLEPLDGQQRLTTLFLLHWYLANHDGAFDEFRSWMAHPRGGSCFTYRTRPAAREFFDALVLHPAPLGDLPARPTALSDWAKDSVWFVRSWLRDPTVLGCLAMLDALHERFAASTGAWARLVSSDVPSIVFQLLPLEDFDLSDELYVKMNARGRPLTPFEVFKAEIERFVDEAFGSEPCRFDARVSWRGYVAHQFDSTWTDLLWGPLGGSRDKEIDAPFMHLIRALAVVHAIDHGDDAGLLERVERLLETPQPGFPLYEALGVVDRAFIEQLIRLLDTLAGHCESPAFIGRADYLNETALFQRVLLARGANQDDGLTLEDWVLFFAWGSFVLRFADDLASDATRAAFHDWTRLVANLAFNTSIDRNDRLVAILRSLRQLAGSTGPGFLGRVAGGVLDEGGAFNQQQRREEQLKAQLILRHSAWRPLLERAETHAYFRGDIEFMLRFCGVFERWTELGSCDWTDEEDAALQRTFAEWYARACAVFPADARDAREFPEFLWERALLATGDYLLPRGSNSSFLVGKDRDASWKRLLRADTKVPDREARRDVVQRVLARIDPANVEESLRRIVAAGLVEDDGKPLPGLRARLVAEPRLLEFCESRMLRLEDGTAYLLRRRQRNGAHIDLFVYDLYLKLKDRAAERAPLDVIECPLPTGSFPPSRLRLGAPLLGLSLTVEKHDSDLQLQLSMATPLPQLVPRLTDWIPDGERGLQRTVPPDVAQAAVLELSALVRGAYPAPMADANA